eukprot:12403351-Karenia_brevis.AAC.1
MSTTSSQPQPLQSTSNPAVDISSDPLGALKFSRLYELVADALRNRKEDLEKVFCKGCGAMSVDMLSHG